METKNELLPISTFDLENDYSTFNLREPISNGFVALDFETATRERNSICEIGIAIVKTDSLESRVWRVRPPENRYEYRNICVHGITPRDTMHCKEFKEVWKEVRPYLDHQLVVIHNSAFDSYVLRDTLLANKLTFPSFVFVCSYRLAKETFKMFPQYGLEELCAVLKIPFEHHHNAEADALACAKVFMKIMREINVSSCAALVEKYGYPVGRFSDNYFRPFTKKTTAKTSSPKNTTHSTPKPSPQKKNLSP